MTQPITMPMCQSCKTDKDVVFSVYANGDWQGYECLECTSVVLEVYNVDRPGDPISHEDFDTYYRPIHDEEGSALIDLEATKEYPERYVWTIVDGDEGVYAAAGQHFVNRTMDYVITEVPWFTGDEVCVWSKDVEGWPL